MIPVALRQTARRTDVWENVMVRRWYLISCGLALGFDCAAHAQGAREIVQQTVQSELAADQNDHSKWSYFEVDRKPKNTVTQWVAETSKGELQRVLETDGQKLSKAQQVNKMESFLRSSDEQAQRRKADLHDDQQLTELVRLLPNAFVWTASGNSNGRTVLHFKPND